MRKRILLLLFVSTTAVYPYVFDLKVLLSAVSIRPDAESVSIFVYSHGVSNDELLLEFHTQAIRSPALRMNSSVISVTGANARRGVQDARRSATGATISAARERQRPQCPRAISPRSWVPVCC